MAASNLKGNIKFEKPGKYRIVVQGRIDQSWSDRLGGMHITTRKGEEDAPKTTLPGHLRDQAQLSGVLNSLYDLHMSILVVECLEDQSGALEK
jgi:hypothetical protein